jgi:hypothetical protein
LHQQQAWLLHACDTLGLNASPKAVAVFNEFQRHHARRASADAECETLYRDLLSQANTQWQPPAMPSSFGANGDLAASIDALSQINCKHNAVLQQLESKLRQAAVERKRVLERLHRIESALNTRHDLQVLLRRTKDRPTHASPTIPFPTSQVSLERCRSALRRLRQTFPFNVSRQAIRSVKQLWRSRKRAA